MNQTTEILRLSRNKLYDLQGNIVYLSNNDLQANDSSYLYFVNTADVPSDGLTQIFSTDEDDDLIIMINQVTLVAKICNDDGYLQFGYAPDSCEEVQLAPTAVSPSSTPASSIPASTPASTPASVPASITPSASPSSTPASSSPASQPPSSSPSDSPSAPPSSTPSVASSVPPSVSPSQSTIPSSPPVVPVYHVAATYFNPSGLDLTQGSTGSIGTDTACVKLTILDQNNQTVTNTEFDFACGSVDDLCTFTNPDNGDTVTSATTDSNGIVRVLFTSMKAGNKTITVTGPDDFTQTYNASVEQVISCANSTISYTGPNLGDLRLGADAPVLQVHVVDLNNDPVVDSPVIFQQSGGLTRRSSNPLAIGYPQNKHPVQKRTPLSTNTTDENGMAYWSDYSSAQGGTQIWSATFGSCPSQTFPAFLWYYDIDCVATTFILNTSYPQSDGSLAVSGTVVGVDGHSIAGAMVQITDPNTGTFIFLVDQTGVYSEDIQYYSWIPNLSSQVSMTIQYDYNDCVFGPLQYTWDMMVDCTVPSTTVNMSLPVAYTTDTVALTIAATDSVGHPSAYLPYTVTGQAGAFMVNGMLDMSGMANLLIVNNNFGTGLDQYSVTLGEPPTQCIMSSQIEWQASPSP